MPDPRPIAADSDMHVLEPADLWQRYIAAGVPPRGARRHDGARRDLRVRVKSQVLLKAGPVRPLQGARRQRASAGAPDQEEAYASAEARGWDADAQLEAMDREGMDLAVLFPSRGLFVLALESTAVSAPTGSSPSSRRRSRAPTTTGSTTSRAPRPSACSAARWSRPTTSARPSTRCAACVREYGFKAVYLPPGQRRAAGRGTTATSTRSGRRASELGVPVCFHGGGRTSLRPDFSLGDDLRRPADAVALLQPAARRDGRARSA